MELSRTQAFRLARSVKVRKLIDDAEKVKSGKKEPLTDAQIDERIDKMISSPNDLAAAKGIELREKRAERREREREASYSNGKAMQELFTESKHGLGYAALMFLDNVDRYGPRINLAGLPLFPELAPNIARDFPKLWRRIRDGLDSECQADADAMATGVPFDIEKVASAMEAAYAAG